VGDTIGVVVTLGVAVGTVEVVGVIVVGVVEAPDTVIVAGAVVERTFSFDPSLELDERTSVLLPKEMLDAVLVGLMALK
jgi:hypothetical protein